MLSNPVTYAVKAVMPLSYSFIFSEEMVYRFTVDDTFKLWSFVCVTDGYMLEKCT